MPSAKDWDSLAAKMDGAARRMTDDPIAAMSMSRMAALAQLRARLRRIRPDLDRDEDQRGVGEAKAPSAK